MQKIKNILLNASILGIFTLICFFSTPLESASNPLDIKLGDSVNIEGDDTSYDNLTGVAKAVGNVRINCGNTDIYAGRAEYTIVVVIFF